MRLSLLTMLLPFTAAHADIEGERSHDDEDVDLDNGAPIKFERCALGEQKYAITWFDSLVGKEACAETCLTPEWGELYKSYDPQFDLGECSALGYTLPVNAAYSSYVSILPSFDVYWY